MSHPTPTHDRHALELQARSLEALVSLLHALHASRNVEDVAKRALLTVSGQLLVRRAALYVRDEIGRFHLQASTGVGRSRIGLPSWDATDAVLALFDDDGVHSFREDALDGAFPAPLVESFDRAARLDSADETIGMLFLGAGLGNSTIDDGGRQLLRTMGVVIGTTLQRVSVQEQLTHARERLEQANLMRQGVMDHVSHEFNTPLMVVKSAGQLLRDAGDEERGALLDMHDESVERLEDLVESILRAASDLEGASESRAYSFIDLLEQIVDPWLLRRSERPATAIVKPGIDIEVKLDALRVESVLEILHRNAREAAVALENDASVFTNVYVAPGGWWQTHDHTDRLAHYAAQRHASHEAVVGLGVDVPEPTDPNDVEVVFEVVDDGRGIPANEVQRVLLPFTLASNSAKLGISGAGMGLPTARRIAEELRGHLRLQSVEGQGTIVALVLRARIAELD